MVLESNNNIILIVIIIFIIFCLFIKYNNHSNLNNCNLKHNNFVQSQDNFTNKQNKKIKFNLVKYVKQFDKDEPSSVISSIPDEIEISNIEEFNYNFNDIDKLKINKDSTKLVSFDKVNKDDKISEKFNKLIGKIDNNITPENLKLIQGTESLSPPSLNLKTTVIYNNSLNDDTIINNNKYKPFYGNHYRKI